MFRRAETDCSIATAYADYTVPLSMLDEDTCTRPWHHAVSSEAEGQLTVEIYAASNLLVGESFLLMGLYKTIGLYKACLFRTMMDSHRDHKHHGS